MHRQLFKVAVVLVLLLCACCYIAEICDTWDNPSGGGNDTEFSVMRLLLCIGAAVAFVQSAQRLLRWISSSALELDLRLPTFAYQARSSSSLFCPPIEASILSLRI